MHRKLLTQSLIEFTIWDFSGGPVVKNPPVKAGDTGSIPVPGRPHVPQGNSALEPQLLSLYSRAGELQQARQAQWEAHALKQEKAGTQQQRLSAAKNK